MRLSTNILFTVGIIILLASPEIFSQRARPRNRGQNGNRGQSGNRGRNPARRQNHRRCQKIQVPMCRGMIGYGFTNLPNKYGHRTQLQVYRALEYLWSFMDIGCSSNFRLFVCSLYLPKCTRRTLQQLPCKETCTRAKNGCEDRMEELQSSWPSHFNCSSLLPRRSKKCIGPKPNGRSCQQHVICRRNQIPICQGLTFSRGSLPNMFLQCSTREITTELRQFEGLIQSNCSSHLRFFLCGIYMPYCIRAENPFAMPCRELCEGIRRDCEATYSRLHGRLPWPSKFQCHRYPDSTNHQYMCVMPSDHQLEFESRIQQHISQINQNEGEESVDESNDEDN
ncbi:atrial natriuretic peptide-converting enzyme-like [Gigantopelta aegis]|uniref:atrial natriuretic peptide-converting enzyme-like n=1 Tax=Gigantopelta aegis TaxID=1735272 RepID=UPI001B8880CC|nr:atrial natriuretic peptide-converting enzyme-like [Gigantopelta aegis]